MITRLGEISLASAVPLLAEFQAAIAVAAGIGIDELSAKITGAGNVLATITVAPPDLSGTITATLATVASLQAAIGGPVVTLQATAIAALLVELEAQLGILTGYLDLEIPSANVSVYVYEGPSPNIGAELQSAINVDLPGVPAQTYALILATTSAAAFASMQLVFRT